MGVIRKTLSISTLGLVGWRSKKERLREAEAELEAARVDLETTAKKESLLKEKLLAAERRVEEAELDAISGARSARRRGARRAKRKHGVGLAGFVDSAVEGAERRGKDVLEDTRRRSKEVRALAEARAAELQARSERARKKAAKRTEKARKRLAERGGEARGRLASVADEASTTVRQKAAKARELRAS